MILFKSTIDNLFMEFTRREPHAKNPYICLAKNGLNFAIEATARDESHKDYTINHVYYAEISQDGNLGAITDTRSKVYINNPEGITYPFN